MCLKLILLIAALSYPVSSYNTFYAENLCSAGATTSKSISVGETGWNSSGILRATQSVFYSNGMNCSIDLKVPADYGIVLSLRYLELRNSQFRSECQDYLQFVSGPTTFTECGPRLDDFSESRSFRFFNNATIKFHTSPSMLGVASGFQISFTAVRKLSTDGTCNDTEFKCRNDICIWRGLTCDGHNNCGDKSDERHGGTSNCGYPSYRFSMRGFFLSVLSILFFSMAITYIFRRYRRNRFVATSAGNGQVPAANAFFSSSYGTYGMPQPVPPNHQQMFQQYPTTPNQPGYPPQMGFPPQPQPTYPPSMPQPPPGYAQTMSPPPPPYTQKAAP